VAVIKGNGQARRGGVPGGDEQGLLFGDEVPPSPEDVGYRGPTACMAAGITYRQLDYWARTKLVEPSVRPASGSGSQRLYGFRDILTLKVVKRLLDTGISLQQIRAAVDYLRTRITSQCRFDLPQLYTEAADLHLKVVAAQKLDVAVGKPTAKIPRTVHPRPRFVDERVLEELLRCQLRTIQISAGHPGAADVQFPRHPDRHRLTVCI